jgi:hypothetical protein
VAKVAHVWAAHPDTPGAGNVCQDARLGGVADLRHDEIYGQAGWTVGLTFHSLAQLARRLRSVRIVRHTTVVSPGKIGRLAINAHGAPGTVFVDGESRGDSALCLDTLSVHEQALSTRIGSSGENRNGAHRNWSSLDRLPWATARSRSAVAAFEGHIVGSQQMPSDRMPSWY